MKRKITLFSKIILLMGITIIALTGCETLSDSGKSQLQLTKVDTSAGAAKQNRFPSLPVQKPGGGKFRIAYVDIDEYPVTGGMLYYVVESLKKDGWIQYDSLPVNPENVDAKMLVNWLAERDLGPYMEFVGSANYYLAYEGEEAVGKSLVDHVRNKKDIDVILTMGTWPGTFIKNLNLEVPLLVYGCIDPIGAGIVRSAADSGNEKIWAQVDPSAFRRQLQFYFDTVPFKNIGMVYNDEVVASIADYELTAKANGFNITKVKIEKLSSENEGNKERYYSKLKEIYEQLIQEDKIDAYLINTDVVTDNSRMEELFKLFYEQKIPIFVQVGDNYIQNGAFMLVSPRDYKGLGAFVSYTLGAVCNGAKPGELPQEYTSSPYLSLNLDVADRIGFTPTFEMLLSSEYIYTSRKQ
ncbi:MAG: ABC transporter substrate binding protein [Heliobacteriaceae bacterium]|nr:ABC transporter substrate binding protein [Heliobacteriaceae bacterium]